MGNILFVCSGNVGRSQIAEGYYNKYSKDKTANSAGTDPSTPNKYPTPSKLIIDLMKEEGIDVSSNQVKYINKDMVNKSEKVFVLCEKHLCPTFLFESNKVTFWEIDDPYKTSIKNSRKIRDQIKTKVMDLIGS